MQYMILEGTRAELEHLVNTMVNEGWSLHGGLCVTGKLSFSPGPSGTPIKMPVYAQAITKEDE